MSDRIALMRNGRIEQLSVPQEMYDRPMSRYVADFIGETNLISGAVRRSDGQTIGLEVAGVTLGAIMSRPMRSGSEAWLSIRPEFLQVSPEGGPVPAGHNLLKATARDTVFVGAISKLYATLADGAADRHPRGTGRADDPAGPGDPGPLAGRAGSVCR